MLRATPFKPERKYGMASCSLHIVRWFRVNHVKDGMQCMLLVQAPQSHLQTQAMRGRVTATNSPCVRNESGHAAWGGAQQPSVTALHSAACSGKRGRACLRVGSDQREAVAGRHEERAAEDHVAVGVTVARGAKVRQLRAAGRTPQAHTDQLRPMQHPTTLIPVHAHVNTHIMSRLCCITAAGQAGARLRGGRGVLPEAARRDELLRVCQVGVRVAPAKVLLGVAVEQAGRVRAQLLHSRRPAVAGPTTLMSSVKHF